jgi:phosphonate transport system permease protein
VVTDLPVPARRQGPLAWLVAVFLVAVVPLVLEGGLPAPREGGLVIARDFLSAALRPAFDWEASSAPLEGHLLPRIAEALGWTLTYAIAALSLALLPGLALGVLAAESAPTPGPGGVSSALRHGARWLLVGLRSLHELLWAVLLLAAVGLGPGVAVAALALPLIGTLGKVFAELLDEADPRPAATLSAAGLRPDAAFLVGRVPVALPDLAAFAFYRLECTFRSSAVLGFFGFDTIGHQLCSSFEEGRYHEVWTELYALLAVILAMEAWSAALRRRFVA